MVVGGPDPGPGQVAITGFGGTTEGGMPQDTPRPILGLADEGEILGTDRVDNPKTLGGSVARIGLAVRDITTEHRGDDRGDVPGPGSFEAVGVAPFTPGGSVGNFRNRGETPPDGERPPWLKAVRLLFIGVVLFGLVKVLAPLLEIGANVTDE